MDKTITQNNSCDQIEPPPPPQVAVVMVPLPAQGHLNQLLHLSRLIAAHNIPVFFTGAATHLRKAKLRLHGWDPSSIATIHFHELPTTCFDNPPPDPHGPHNFPSQIVPSLLSTTHLRRPLYSFVEGISGIFRRVVVIYDFLMSYVVQDVGCIQNADCYIFRSNSIISACSWESKSLPDLPSELVGIMQEIPSVSGYYSEKFSEFLDLQHTAKNISCGEIFNSNRELEGLFLDLLSKRGAKIWALGPFNPVTLPPQLRSRHRCLNWLDKQEPSSVIYVSFGTTCSFSDQQISEISLGLERSNHKFLWVLREADKGDIFTGDVRETQLPTGFEERVRERGIVVRDWAPQLDILGHGSVGGFMSHCGWNSCIESMSMGVPIAAWPLHSDQPANAVLITRVLRTGLMAKMWSRRGEDVVGWEMVEVVVRRLMASQEGDEMRIRVGAIKNSMIQGGATQKMIRSFINHIVR